MSFSELTDPKAVLAAIEEYDRLGQAAFLEKYGYLQKKLAEQAGFELAVRLAKFAFEISTEVRALVAKLAFRENFAPGVLDENIRLVSAVRFYGRAGGVPFE